MSFFVKKKPCNSRAFFELVGVARFELATSRPPDARATKLRYTPNISLMGIKAYVRYINALCI